MVEARAHWSYEADGSAADESDETGFRTLQVLVDVLSSRTQELAALRATCETIIWWSGDSDSSQGGFVLPVEMMEDLAALGCDLYGTTYLDDDEGFFDRVWGRLRSRFIPKSRRNRLRSHGTPSSR
jgi:hypothetical protein